MPFPSFRPAISSKLGRRLSKDHASVRGMACIVPDVAIIFLISFYFMAFGIINCSRVGIKMFSCLGKRTL